MPFAAPPLPREGSAPQHTYDPSLGRPKPWSRSPLGVMFAAAFVVERKVCRELLEGKKSA